MTTFGTIATIGAATLIVGVGVGIYIMSKKKNSEECLDFDNFRDVCISTASKFDNNDVATAILVIDKVNDNVIPSLYRKYKDGKVTRVRLGVSSFPYDFLPNEIKDKFNNGQAILTKLKNEL